MLSLVLSISCLLLLALCFVFAPLCSEAKWDRPRWPTLSLTASFIVIASISLYLYIGSATHYISWKKTDAKRFYSMQRLVADLSDPMVEKHLQQHLQAYPHDSKGWFYLGELYLFKQKYAKAQAALAKVMQQQPHNQRAMMLHAEAAYYAKRSR